MAEQPPNIVLIITDQQRYDTIAALGFPYMDTPHLDRLVREGVSFTQAFVASASCVPTRASLFQGCFPHTNGIYSNGESWSETWVTSLAKAGYYCVNIGKMHTSPPEDPAGFHERFVVENKDRLDFYSDRWDMALRAAGVPKPGRRIYRQRDDYRDRLGAFEWGIAEELHPDVFVGDLAAWWINSRPRVEPLFLQIGFPGPHPPYDAIPRYIEPYSSRDLPVPDVSQAEMDAQPAALKGMRLHNIQVDHDSICWSAHPTPEQLHRLRAHYLANVTMIDEKIGQVLAALQAKGYLENAVVLFTSDHGDCLGDHGLSQKWSMYDTITRVPLIVWAPGRFAGGREIDALVQQMDIATVILELAGCEKATLPDTISLTPLLAGREGAAGRDYVFAEQAGDGGRPAARLMTMVRNRDWKLVHYVGQPDGELYDLRHDPHEVANLWANPDYRAHREELLAVLLEWALASGLQRGSWRRGRPNPFRAEAHKVMVQQAVPGRS